MDEFRFTDKVDGVMERRIELAVGNSGWLCCMGKGGRDVRALPSTSSGFGISEGGGRTGNNVAFRYSLPSGVSRDCTYLNVKRRIKVRSMKAVKLTIVANSANIFEHRSASRVPTYNFLFPIMPGITTKPGRLPRLRVVLPSLSSNTKQLLARGKIAPGGNNSVMEALNCARMEDRESL